MAKLNNSEINRKELLKKMGNIEQVAYIRPYEMIEGRAKGVKAFEVLNGGGLDGKDEKEEFEKMLKSF